MSENVFFGKSPDPVTSSLDWKPHPTPHSQYIDKSDLSRDKMKRLNIEAVDAV